MPVVQQAAAGAAVLRSLDEALPAEAARVREKQPQILLLSDLELTTDVLAPQCEAFPWAKAPAWPRLEGRPSLAAFALACCNAWFWGVNRIIDPGRPYYLVACGSSGPLAIEMGRQLATLERPPAGVVLIGRFPGGEVARKRLQNWLRRQFDQLAAACRPGRANGVQLTAAQRTMLRRSAAAADPVLVKWAARAIDAWRPSAEELDLLPFAVHQIFGDEETRRSEMVDERKCTLRGSPESLNLTRAVEVNAFLLRVILGPKCAIQLAPESTPPIVAPAG